MALGDPQAWLITSARYFQTLDFYTEYLDLPNEELPDAIREAVRWHWDGPLSPEEVARDIQLADMQGRIYIYNSYIFRAMPFFLMGVSAKPYTTKIQGLSIPKPLIGGLVVFGTLLAIAERCRYGEVQFYIGSYIVVASLLIYAIKSPAMSNPFWEHIGRDLSMHIYILHIAVGKAMDLFGKYAGFGGGPFGLRFACSLPLL